MASPVRDTWEPRVVSDTTTNDSDKTITVTAAEQWHILSVYVKLATSADVGNRQLVLQLQNSAGTVVDEMRAGAVQAASATYYYAFHPGGANMTTVIDSDFLTTHIPPTWILAPGDKIRLFDNNAVAAAADDMEIRLRVNARSV